MMGGGGWLMMRVRKGRGRGEGPGQEKRVGREGFLNGEEKQGETEGKREGKKGEREGKGWPECRLGGGGCMWAAGKGVCNGPILGGEGAGWGVLGGWPRGWARFFFGGRVAWIGSSKPDESTAPFPSILSPQTQTQNPLPLCVLQISGGSCVPDFSLVSHYVRSGKLRVLWCSLRRKARFEEHGVCLCNV